MSDLGTFFVQSFSLLSKVNTGLHSFNYNITKNGLGQMIDSQRSRMTKSAKFAKSAKCTKLVKLNIVNLKIAEVYTLIPRPSG